MSLLRRIEFENDSILITLEMNKREYDAVTPDVKKFITLPADTLDRTLTTGKLGNGNRIMVPNKFLRSHDIDILRKFVKSKIVDIGEKKFLIIELEDKKRGIPKFSDIYETQNRI